MAAQNPDTPTPTHERTSNPPRLTGRDWVAVALLVGSVVGMFWKVVFTSAMFFYATSPTTPSPARASSTTLPPGLSSLLESFFELRPAGVGKSQSALLLSLYSPDRASSRRCRIQSALCFAFRLGGDWGPTCWRGSGGSRARRLFLQRLSSPSAGRCSPPATSITRRRVAPGSPGPSSPPTVPWKPRPASLGSAYRDLLAPVARRRTVHLDGGVRPFFRLCDVPLQHAAGIVVQNSLRIVTIFFLVGCGMLLLCAVQLLPASDLLSHSRRGEGLSFRETSQWSE